MTTSLEQIRAELEAATPGPWTYLANGTSGATQFRGLVVIYQEGKPRWVCEVPTEEIVKNGPLIANAPLHLAAMIPVVDAALEAVMVLREEHIEEEGACFACETEWPCWAGALIEAVEVFQSMSAHRCTPGEGCMRAGGGECV